MHPNARLHCILGSPQYAASQVPTIVYFGLRSLLVRSTSSSSLTRSSFMPQHSVNIFFIGSSVRTELQGNLQFYQAKPELINHRLHEFGSRFWRKRTRRRVLRLMTIFWIASCNSFRSAHEPEERAAILELYAATRQPGLDNLALSTIQTQTQRPRSCPVARVEFVI
jgi:hypothetical protein